MHSIPNIRDHNLKDVCVVDCEDHQQIKVRINGTIEMNKINKNTKSTNYIQYKNNAHNTTGQDKQGNKSIKMQINHEINYNPKTQHI